MTRRANLIASSTGRIDRHPGLRRNDPAVVAAVRASCPTWSGVTLTPSIRRPYRAHEGAAQPHRAPRERRAIRGQHRSRSGGERDQSVLLNRVKTAGERDGGFILSYEGAFHGRTLGSLASPTARRRGLASRRSTGRMCRPRGRRRSARDARREERSLKQLGTCGLGAPATAEKSRENFRRELDAIDVYIAEPGSDVTAFRAGPARAAERRLVRRSRPSRPC